MHKSLGNVVSPQDVINKYGADILRLWVALSDYNDDVRISDKLLEGPVDTYRKIRNTFRYLLGNLSDYNPSKNRIENAKLLEFDLYILIKLSDLTNNVLNFYRNFEYRSAIKAISDFCICDLSSFYLDALKDRLYTMPLNSRERRSAQTVLYEILKSLLIMTSPVLSFTSEEAWQVFRKDIDSNLSESVFFNDWPKVSIESSPLLIEKWNKIMSIREKVLKLLEDLRQKREIGSSVEAEVYIKFPTKEFDFFKGSENDFVSAFIVSDCHIEKDDNIKEMEIIVKHASGNKCPRCWQWRKDIGKDKDYPYVCGKCAMAIKALNPNGV